MPYVLVEVDLGTNVTSAETARNEAAALDELEHRARRHAGEYREIDLTPEQLAEIRSDQEYRHGDLLLTVCLTTQLR